MKLQVKSIPFKGQALDILEIFKDEPYLFSLDSSGVKESSGRFSFIGFDPFYSAEYKGKNALRRLAEDFERFEFPARTKLTPFACGMAGVMAYDAGLYFENIKFHTQDDLGLPDCSFGFYDTILTIDHKDRKLIMTSCGRPGKDTFSRKKDAVGRISYIESRIKQEFSSAENQSSPVKKIRKTFKSDFVQSSYCKAVRRVLDHIRQGDIYQVNLSQRFAVSLDKKKFDPISFYRKLRSLSPSNFGGYFSGKDFKLFSSSPERFLNVRGDLIETRPMKGTRPRGENSFEDNSLRDDLVKSAKEKAELLMITDLERNDLGRICRFGSVKVKKMRTLEKYKTVFQTTSTIEGQLKKNVGLFEILKACFPGGSVTGCPKIRAMEIIETIEPVRRGFYTGAMGYVSFAKDMDFNILIRTILDRKNKMYFHVGGGIVADSEPKKEYEETLVKAKALMQSLETI